METSFLSANEYQERFSQKAIGSSATVALALLYAFGFGAVFGLVGFGCGVVGPRYLNPTSNLGPITGYLVTGPGGVVAGVVVGAVVAYSRLAPAAALATLGIGSLLVALATLALSLP